METLDYNPKHWEKQCPKYDCRKDSCKCGLRKVTLPAVLGDDSSDSPIAPKNGNYCNAIVVYEANNHLYLYSSEGIPTLVNVEGGNVEEIIEQLQSDLAQEILDRKVGDKTLQDEIDDIKNSPDVVDIVDTYADLQAYDTSKLGDNDIIRVLTDETHDGASSYYRWDKQTETWTYVGSIQTAANTIFYANLSETGNTRHIYKNSDMTGTISVQELLDANEDGQVILRMSSAQTPENFNDAYLQNTYVGVGDYQFLFLDNRNYYEYDGTATTDTSYYYSKSTIQLELTAGNNITITSNTISATDTTYSNFTGTDGVTAGTAGLVPAPAITDVDKFLKSDGTWDTAGGGSSVTVVQTTGTSTTDVMSQNATSTMVFADPATKQKVQIGDNAAATGGRSVAIGNTAKAEAVSTIAVGRNSDAKHQAGTAIGYYARTNGEGSVAMGAESVAGSSVNTQGATAIGMNTTAGAKGSVAIGAYAVLNNSSTDIGKVQFGTTNTSYGYNSTNYRLLTGVYDGQDLHDVATVAQGNTLSTAAPDTSTAGVLGQLWTDTTNMHTYQCTAVSGSTYTWVQRW